MTPIEGKLRAAGILMILGLAMTIVSLIWKAPLAFLLFAGISGTLTLAGVVLYLYALVSASTHHP